MDTIEEPAMELVAIRRARLKEWFSDRALPRNEKAYLSQLINGKVVFGDRAARRLEKDYRMPKGYLDGALAAKEAQSFGDRIKQFRKESGITQQQLAAFVGVSASAVGNWENRPQETPKGDNLLKLAEAFGVDPAELLGQDWKGAKELADEVQLLAAFRVLPKERQLIAIKLLEALQ
jgi:transcriptional regulator with XRE-family HTH domain